MPFTHFLLYGLGKNLVEKGIVKGSFNRFNFQEKPTTLLQIIKAPFQLMDNLNNDNDRMKSFVNLIVLIEKTQSHFL